MMRWIRRLFIILSGVGLTIILYAQEGEIISSDAVNHLQSVQYIDFADMDADINIGWFVANDTATEFIVFDNEYFLYRFSDQGEILDLWTYVSNPQEQIFSVIDGTFAFGEFYILYIVDGQYFINGVELGIDGSPLDLGHDDHSLYLEVQIDSELLIFRLNQELKILSQFEMPSDPIQPVMRVGRIPIPIIVQSTFEGVVDIYNYDTLIGQYKPADMPTVFGSINDLHTHFAWVDPNSTTLHLLNLETGENTVLAELNGEYAQYYLLAKDASLIIAINVNFEPNAIAWDTATGERYDLGAYRDCQRIPDKVALSADGTALIIGCDTGLDIWRVIDEAETN